MPEPPSWAHPGSQLPVSQPEKALYAPHTHSATRTLSLEAADTRRASHQAIHDLDEQKPETQAVSGLDLVGLDRRGSSVHSRGKGSLDWQMDLRAHRCHMVGCRGPW